MRALFFFVLLFPATVAAQDAVSGLLAFPKGDASWKVTIRPATDTEKKRARNREEEEAGTHGRPDDAALNLKAIEVTRTGPLTRSRLVWSNGKSSEVWQIAKPTVLLIESPDGSSIDIDMLMIGTDSLMPDERLFRWISGKNMTGMKKFEGRECMQFSDLLLPPGPPSLTAAGAPSRVLFQAWIDAETRLPVGMRDSNTLYVFKFSEPPDAPLELPSRFQKELTRAMNSVPKPTYLGKPRSWEARR